MEARLLSDYGYRFEHYSDLTPGMMIPGPAAVNVEPHDYLPSSYHYQYLSEIHDPSLINLDQQAILRQGDLALYPGYPPVFAHPLMFDQQSQHALMSSVPFLPGSTFTFMHPIQLQAAIPAPIPAGSLTDVPAIQAAALPAFITFEPPVVSTSTPVAPVKSRTRRRPSRLRLDYVSESDELSARTPSPRASTPKSRISQDANYSPQLSPKKTSRKDSKELRKMREELRRAQTKLKEAKKSLSPSPIRKRGGNKPSCAPNFRENLAVFFSTCAFRFPEEYEILDATWILSNFKKSIAQKNNSAYITYVRHIPTDTLVVACMSLLMDRLKRPQRHLSHLINQHGFSRVKFTKNSPHRDEPALKPFMDAIPSFVKERPEFESFSGHLKVYFCGGFPLLFIFIIYPRSHFQPPHS